MSRAWVRVLVYRSGWSWVNAAVTQGSLNPEAGRWCCGGLICPAHQLSALGTTAGSLSGPLHGVTGTDDIPADEVCVVPPHGARVPHSSQCLEVWTVVPSQTMAPTELESSNWWGLGRGASSESRGAAQQGNALVPGAPAPPPVWSPTFPSTGSHPWGAIDAPHVASPWPGSVPWSRWAPPPPPSGSRPSAGPQASGWVHRGQHLTNRGPGGRERQTDPYDTFHLMFPSHFEPSISVTLACRRPNGGIQCFTDVPWVIWL